jgi:predicted nucleic acid-binding protein
MTMWRTPAKPRFVTTELTPAAVASLAIDRQASALDLQRPSYDRHAASRDARRYRPFARQAVQLDCILTLRPASEFYAAVTRKRVATVTDALAQAEDWLAMFRMIAASAGAVRTALKSAASGQSSYWDALLIATGAEAGCATILTEDLSDGSLVHGVRVLNPFGTSARTPTAAALLATG